MDRARYCQQAAVSVQTTTTIASRARPVNTVKLISFLRPANIALWASQTTATLLSRSATINEKTH